MFTSTFFVNFVFLSLVYLIFEARNSKRFRSSCCPCPLSLKFLSLSLRLLSARQREEQRFNSVKHRYYVASLILHASIAEITAQLLSLSYVYLISSDDGAIIMIFLCRLTSWKGELVM